MPQWPGTTRKPRLGRQSLGHRLWLERAKELRARDKLMKAYYYYVPETSSAAASPSSALGPGLCDLCRLQLAQARTLRACGFVVRNTFIDVALPFSDGDSPRRARSAPPSERPASSAVTAVPQTAAPVLCPSRPFFCWSCGGHLEGI
jgi:hypothetical protein